MRFANKYTDEQCYIIMIRIMNIIMLFVLNSLFPEPFEIIQTMNLINDFTQIYMYVI